MAFVATDLACMATGGGNCIWLYRTTDTDTVLSTAAYFNGAKDVMNVHDLIFAITATGGTPVLGLCHVLTNDGTDVDVSDFTVLTSVDTE
jgi:hypothetical protein